MSADVPPQLPLKELPEFLRKRIEVAARREEIECWEWVGRFKTGRQRAKMYPATETGIYRSNATRIVRERATPKVKHPLTGKEADAYRLVYSFATCIPICDVPQLQRCSNDRCVSPHHVFPVGQTPAQRKREQGLETDLIVEDDEFTDERCLALLRDADGGEGVPSFVEKDTAADEAGIPRDKLTEDCWDQYVREEEAKENSDAA